MCKLGDVSASGQARGSVGQPELADSRRRAAGQQSPASTSVDALTQARGWPAHRCGIRPKPRTMGCPASRLLATHKVSACAVKEQGAVRRLRSWQGKDAQHEEAQRTQAGWQQRCSRGPDRMRGVPVECGGAPGSTMPAPTLRGSACQELAAGCKL